MSAREVAERILFLTNERPNYRLRFEGGQGAPFSVSIDDEYKEIIVYTGRG